MRGNRNKRPLNSAGLGCMSLAIGGGFVLGLNAGGRVLPVPLNWLFALMFGAFFGVLAFVFTGMKVRRDRGVITETIMTIPAHYAASLKQAIERANPPAHLAPGDISALDADLTELANLARLLQSQPRAGTQPPLKARLEELALKWLDEDSLNDWLATVEAQN